MRFGESMKDESTDKKEKSELLAPLSLQEICKMLIKHYNLHEGKYDISFEFSIGVGPIGPNQESLVPGAMIGIQRIGLVKVPDDAKIFGQAVVDAAEVNPLKKASSKK